MSEIKTGQVFHLPAMITVKPGRIASRRLVPPADLMIQASNMEAVLYALSSGETISAETAVKTRLIHVLEGELDMVIAGCACTLSTGDGVWVPARTWHEFAAEQDCKFLQISL